MNERIVIDPKICHGKPVIRGARLPVAIVVGSLAGGMTFDEVEREYGITKDDIRAALKFAGELVEQEQLPSQFYVDHSVAAATSRQLP
jgi:uncharacterized protein (DUF433 family)